MPTETFLRPGSAAEIGQALTHALQFGRRKHFKLCGEMVATITAAHLGQQLRMMGIVVMKAPPAETHGPPPVFVVGDHEPKSGLNSIR